MNEHRYVKEKQPKDPRNKQVEIPHDDYCLMDEAGINSNDPNIVSNRNGKIIKEC